MESSSADFSVVVWALAALVGALTAHVSLSWLQRAQRRPELKTSWRGQLLASLTLGSGMCATAVLSLHAESLPFALGYGSVAAPVLWLGAVVGSLPIVFWLTRDARWWAVLGCGVLLSALIAGLQAGWVWGAGFRPGVVWSRSFLAGALVVTAIGICGGLWVTRSERHSRSSDTPHFYFGGAALFGLSMVFGQELVVVAAGLADQKGSVYRYQVPDTLLTLACGALVPITLVVMAIDLAIRRRKRERSRSDFQPVRRRKRRHRVRQL